MQPLIAGMASQVLLKIVRPTMHMAPRPEVKVSAYLSFHQGAFAATELRILASLPLCTRELAFSLMFVSAGSVTECFACGVFEARSGATGTDSPCRR